MLRGKDDKCDAVNGVWAGGKNAKLLAIIKPKGDLHPLAFPNPVPLHDLYSLRPFDVAEVEEFLGIVSNSEEPLLQVFSGYRCPAALAKPLAHHLLIGEHCLAVGAPINWCLGSIGKAGLIELEEEPLCPFVVIGEAGYHLAPPVVDSAHALELRPHHLNVPHRPCIRVDAAADGSVLRRKAEGIEAHGVKHFVALHPHEAGVDVGGCHGIPVADVEVSRGVGVHGEFVMLGTWVVLVDLIEVVLGPPFLPLSLDLLRVIPRCPFLTHTLFHPLSKRLACLYLV